MKININNVEEVLLMDSTVWEHIPDCRIYYDHWKMVKFFPHMSKELKKIHVDLINSIGLKEIASLQEYFGEEVEVVGANHELTKNYKFGIGEIDGFNNDVEFVDAIVYRDKDTFSVTFWR